MSTTNAFVAGLLDPIDSVIDYSTAPDGSVVAVVEFADHTRANAGVQNIHLGSGSTLRSTAA